VFKEHDGEDHDLVKVSFTVTNTGKRAGAEIAELYVGEKNPKGLGLTLLPYSTDSGERTIREALVGGFIVYAGASEDPRIDAVIARHRVTVQFEGYDKDSSMSQLKQVPSSDIGPFSMVLVAAQSLPGRIKSCPIPIAYGKGLGS
jgi:hypothetical protein